MMPLPYFKCYPSDFLNGVADLSPNALAIYTICMMRMYDEDGSISDDPVRIARRCNMWLPTCKKALDELDSGGKIVREDGRITNGRVEVELAIRRQLSAKQSANARKTFPQRERTDAETDNKINGHDQPTVSQTEAKQEPTTVKVSVRQTSTVSSSADALSAFRFEGKVIRLTDEDFELWETAFKHIELSAALVARDAWLASQPESTRKKWFITTSQHLKTENAKAAKPGPSSYPVASI